MAKPFLRYKAVRVPLYNGKLVLIASNSAKQVRRVVPHFKKEDKEFYAHAWQIDYHGTEGYAMILNFGNEYNYMTHGAVAHEALHLVHYIADNRGIKADFDNDEPLTYLLGWIVNQVYAFFKANGLEVK